MLPSGTDDDATAPGARAAGGPDEQALAREERWEELATLLIERAERAVEPWRRAQDLVRAALLFETRLEAPDKAYLILETAFHEDYTNEEVARELARVAGAQGKWRELLASCEAARAQLPGERQAELLVALARFHEQGLRDPEAAERALAEALARRPDDPVALRALADLYGRRGEWGRAAPLVARLAEGSRDPAERLRLHLEAAEIYDRRLRAREEAAGHYRRVLAVSPGHTVAAEALAEIAWEAGDLATARPLLEALIPEVEGRSRADGARLHGRLAEAAARDGDRPVAREHLRRAHELDPRDLTFVERWAALAWDERWWEDVRYTCERLLARPDAGLAGARKAECMERLGRACLALGDAVRAADVLGKGLEIAPDHRGCREAVIEAYEAVGDHAAAVHHQRALAALSSSPDERFAQLVALARRHRDQAGDPAAAIAAFEEALAIRPDDHGALHELLDLLTAGRQWKRAVQVLERLTAGETGRARARYLVATANILNYELHAADEAIELYNQALDEDPDDLKTFERIDKILTAKRAWRDEARNYRRMIKRIAVPPPPDKRATLLALWRGLGEIYRSRLTDLPAAAAAYEVCAQLDPDDPTYPQILAELLELQGPEGFSRAAQLRTDLLERARTPEELAAQLRTLRVLYAERRQADRLFCVCAALVAIGLADDHERAFYERHAGRPWAHPRGALGEELWQRCLYHPRQDKRISQALAAVGAAVASLGAREARAWGLDPRRKVAAESDPALVPQLLVYASALLGLGRPALYLHPDVPGEIDLAAVLENGQLVPSFVVGAGLTAGRSEREVAFVIARRLAFLRIEHLLLWPHVAPGIAELRVVLAALVKLFQPGFEAPELARPAARQYLTLFQRSLPPQMLEPLMAVVPGLAQDWAVLDVAEWAAAAEQTASRAGLLVCGDLLAAVRALATEGRARGGNPDEAIWALVRWSVSADHLALREQLGLAIEV